MVKPNTWSTRRRLATPEEDIKMAHTAPEEDSSSRPVRARAKWSGLTPDGWQGQNDPGTTLHHRQFGTGAKWSTSSITFERTPWAMWDRSIMVNRKRPRQQSSITFKKTPPAMWDRGRMVNRKRPPPQSTISTAGIYVQGYQKPEILESTGR
ncbi:hypothetical protein LXL04_015376 [Taraxacum kok-saghyz]